MKTHYVCPECGFLSKFSGTCQNETCVRNGEPLKRCSCEDGKHVSVLIHSSSDETENSSEQQDGEFVDNDHSTKTIDLDNDSE